MTELKTGSLFAGVGGICLGLMQAKNPKYAYKLAFANEMDPYACITYRANFSHCLLEGDINRILHPETSGDEEYYRELNEKMFAEPIDVLDGGFPCQAFSIAGEQKGFADERGNLFLSIIEVINEMGRRHGRKPRFLFLENVKNLQSHDNGKTYAVIKEKLEECGYIIKSAVLNTMDYSDIPQNRERIYILGFLNKADADAFDMFDRLSEFRTSLTEEERTDIIRSIIDDSVTDPKYFYTKEKYPDYFEEEGTVTKKEKRVNIAEEITEQNRFYQLRRGLYVRENKSHVCPTLTANMGTGGHNVPLILTSHGIRKITPKEAFRLQGFPVDNGYVLPNEYDGKPLGDSHFYKQAGNSVSVPVITLIAEQLLKACQKGDETMSDYEGYVYPADSTEEIPEEQVTPATEENILPKENSKDVTVATEQEPAETKVKTVHIQANVPKHLKDRLHEKLKAGNVSFHKWVEFCIENDMYPYNADEDEVPCNTEEDDVPVCEEQHEIPEETVIVQEDNEQFDEGSSGEPMPEYTVITDETQFEETKPEEEPCMPEKDTDTRISLLDYTLDRELDKLSAIIRSMEEHDLPHGLKDALALYDVLKKRHII